MITFLRGARVGAITVILYCYGYVLFITVRRAWREDWPVQTKIKITAWSLIWPVVLVIHRKDAESDA